MQMKDISLEHDFVDIFEPLSEMKHQRLYMYILRNFQYCASAHIEVQYKVTRGPRGAIMIRAEREEFKI